MNRIRETKAFAARFGFGGTPSISAMDAEIQSFIAKCVESLPPGSIWRVQHHLENVDGSVCVILEYEYDKDEPVYKDWVQKRAI